MSLVFLFWLLGNGIEAKLLEGVDGRKEGEQGGEAAGRESLFVPLLLGTALTIWMEGIKLPNFC
jgi:hypothetical protein